jgi:hypothetical protein
MRQIIENIQLLHQCKKNRDEHLLQIIQENDSGDIDPQLFVQHQIDNNDDDHEDEILNVIAHTDDIVDETDVPSTIINSETIYFNKLLSLECVDEYESSIILDILINVEIHLRTYH